MRSTQASSCASHRLLISSLMRSALRLPAMRHSSHTPLKAMDALVNAIYRAGIR
jgi:hypothetical protein